MGPPPAPATGQGSCPADGIEGKVASIYTQTVGGTKVCCPKTCGTCGGPGCASFPGGKSECCVGNGYKYGITASKKSCSDNAPPCIIMGDTPATPTTEMAAVSAPACDSIGKGDMCSEACVSTCRGMAPGFKVAGCATESYCDGATPSWAVGSVCTCPPTKAPLVPTCDAAGKSSLCDVACSSTCRGDAPGFKVAGCAIQKYCTTPPRWAQTSLCSCPNAKPEPPPPPATSEGSCPSDGIEGKVAAAFAQSVGGTKVCCPKTCGTCGGPGCADFPGGKSECCVGNGYKYGITASKKSCSDNAPPCIIMGDAPATTEMFSLATRGGADN